MKYALGIIAGEGCFTIGTRKSGGKVYPNPRLIVKMKHTDIDTLKYLQKTFGGIGRINSERGGEMASWKVRSKDDLRAAVKLIRESDCSGWERSDKFENFECWAEAVDIYKKKQLTSENAKKIYQIAKDRLNIENGRDVDWDEYIRMAEANPYGFVCGEPKTSSDGVCQRQVPSENETCWSH